MFDETYHLEKEKAALNSLWTLERTPQFELGALGIIF